MINENQKELATQLAELVGATIQAIPNQTEDQVKEYIGLIAEKLTAIATQPAAGTPIKEITENVIDVLEAISNVLPPATDPKKIRQQRRFKNSIGVLSNLFHLFGLN